MIRKDWALINDCEIITQGTKKHCIEEFYRVNRPWAFSLVKLDKKMELQPQWKRR